MDEPERMAELVRDHDPDRLGVGEQRIDVDNAGPIVVDTTKKRRCTLCAQRDFGRWRRWGTCDQAGRSMIAPHRDRPAHSIFLCGGHRSIGDDV
jgi:hypothetical protein